MTLSHQEFTLSLFVLTVVIPVIVAIITGLGTAVKTYQALRPAPRRRISYRVHLDNGIGAQPDIAGVAELMVRRRRRDGTYRDVPDASLALVRISNDGGLDISKADYIEPVIFTFGTRKVVGVEVKDVTDAQRAVLLGRRPGDHQDAKDDLLHFDPNGNNWVRLPRMQLNKKDRFRMLVLLSGDGKGVTASGLLNGAIKGGGVVEEVGGIGPNRVTRQAFTLGLLTMVSLAVLSLMLFFFNPLSKSEGHVRCVAGSLTVSGSSAFAPAATDAAALYHKSCPSATITVLPPVDSAEGVRNLAKDGQSNPDVRANHLTMSDGLVSGFPQLQANPIAVVIFSVVVNNKINVHSLTPDQIQKIYNGQFTNWSDLGGADRPIYIVSRIVGSGTRSTFDQKVLHDGELDPNSQNCTSRDPTMNSNPKLPSSPVIVCNLNLTEDVLSTVNDIDGAMGYADVSKTSASQPTDYPNITQVQLNGHNPDPESVKSGQYPFWAVEYAYTYGSPNNNSLLSAFLSYLSGDAVKISLQNYGHIPCTDNQDKMIPQCSE